MIVSERAKDFAPVPYADVKADDERSIPFVVVIFDPADTTIAESIMTLNILLPITPSESVATIVS